MKRYQNMASAIVAAALGATVPAASVPVVAQASVVHGRNPVRHLARKHRSDAAASEVTWDRP